MRYAHAVTNEQKDILGRGARMQDILGHGIIDGKVRSSNQQRCRNDPQRHPSKQLFHSEHVSSK